MAQNSVPQQQMIKQENGMVDLRESTQIIHVKNNSDVELEALFNIVMDPNHKHQSQIRPMRERQLPKSFWSPPETGSRTHNAISHSREGSTDSQDVPIGGQMMSDVLGHPPGLQIAHSRAHSSPASLQQTMAASNAQTQHQHLRQQSFDILDEIPLPSGWEMATAPSGQKYFLNHQTQTTTWEDPRKSSVLVQQINLNQLQQQQVEAKAPVLPGSFMQQPIQQPPPPMIEGVGNHPQMVNLLAAQTLGPLPDGWEQAVTPQGETYFINHSTKSTSWFDPRIPLHLQKSSVQAQLQQAQAAAAAGRSGMNNTLNQTPIVAGLPPSGAQHAHLDEASTQSMSVQQYRRLQRLANERDRLRLRGEELEQMGLVKQRINNCTVNNAMSPQQQPLPSSCPGTPDKSNVANARSPITVAISPHQVVSTTGIDPFLGSAPDYHSRQESADSGLGMTANYSMPHTPEDFLSNMDDNMDSVDGTNSVPTPTNDLRNLDLGENSNMDSDDLEPSLREELNTDLLNDVELQQFLNNGRMDGGLTWL